MIQGLKGRAKRTPSGGGWGPEARKGGGRRSHHRGQDTKGEKEGGHLNLTIAHLAFALHRPQRSQRNPGWSPWRHAAAIPGHPASRDQSHPQAGHRPDSRKALRTTKRSGALNPRAAAVARPVSDKGRICGPSDLK